MPGAGRGIRAVDRRHHLPRAGADRACGTCRASFLPKVYLDAVTDAGGIAVLLPPQPVDPRDRPHACSAPRRAHRRRRRRRRPGALRRRPRIRAPGAPRTDRDAWEDALLDRGASTRELPFLGICRGAQVLNVALGGTLHQHLPDVVGSDAVPARRPPCSARARSPSSPARGCGPVGSASATAPAPCTCYHHQALDEVADGPDRDRPQRRRRRSRRSSSTAVPFGLGVQWHPEEDAADRRLFAGLVDAARAPRTATRQEPRVSHTIINPADEAVVATVASRLDRGDGRRDRPRRSGAARLGRTRARRSRRGCCAASPRPSTAPSRSSPRSRCATPGTRSRRRAGRPGTCATCSTTTRPSPERLFGAPDPGRRRPRRHLPGAARRRRRDRAVELPDDDRVVGLRARARGRQRGRAEARRVDAAHGHPARPSSPSRPACPTGCSRCVPGKGSVVGERFVTQRDRAQDRVHRVRPRSASRSWRAAPTR